MLRTHNLKDRQSLSTKQNNSKAGKFIVNLEVLPNQFIIHGSDELSPRLMSEVVNVNSISMHFITDVGFTGHTKTWVNKLKEDPVMDPQAFLVCSISIPR